MAASFTGCKINPNAKINDKPAIEQKLEEAEQKVLINYTVIHGNTLEGIVRSYSDNNIQKEIDKVCRDNKLSNPNRILIGQVLKLEIPVSKLESFGYTASYGEVNQWEAMDHFVYEAFNAQSSEVHPQNMMFWRDKQYVVGHLGDDAPAGLENSTETPLLYKAASAIEDLSIMTGDQYGFYSEEDIKSKEAEILEYYYEAIDIAERNSGKKFGVDYILEPPVTAVPKDQTLNK